MDGDEVLRDTAAGNCLYMQWQWYQRFEWQWYQDEQEWWALDSRRRVISCMTVLLTNEDQGHRTWGPLFFVYTALGDLDRVRS